MTHLYQWFTPLAAILLLVLTSAICEESQTLLPHLSEQPIVKDRAETHKRNGGKKEKQSEPQPGVAIGAMLGKENAKAKEEHGDQDSSNRVYKVQVVSQAPSDWWFRLYVIFSGLAMASAAVSLWFIRQQVIETKHTAEAAKASADALINIERPWLLVSNPQNKRGSSPGEKSYLVFRVTNYGKTPAAILEVGGTAKFVGDIEELSPKPEYGKAIFYNSRPLASGMESGDIHIEYDPRIRDGRALLTGFGFVKYRGPFDGKPVLQYETDFSYCFYGYGENRPCGLPGYNKHT